MAQITHHITFKDDKNNTIKSISDTEAMAAILQANGGNPFSMAGKLTLLIGDDFKKFKLRNFETYYYTNTIANMGNIGESHDFNSESIYYLTEIKSSY